MPIEQEALPPQDRQGKQEATLECGRHNGKAGQVGQELWPLLQEVMQTADNQAMAKDEAQLFVGAHSQGHQEGPELQLAKRQ